MLPSLLEMTSSTAFPRPVWLLFVLSSFLLGCRSDPAPPSLFLLLTVDTLRADHLGTYGGELDLTPHLDALAEESQVFTAAYAASAFTLPSLSALLTGRYPEELGIWSNESAVPDSVPTFASALQERGWRTAAVVSNFVLRESSGLARGFDLYDDELPQLEQVRKWPERIASHTTDAALSTLEACATGPEVPCFLWVHYQDPHGPYAPPGNRRKRYLEVERKAPDGQRLLPVAPEGRGGIPSYQYLDGRRDVAFYRAGYDAEIHYMDEQLGRLLEGLRERGLAEDALIVFAADHGEALGENDYWFAHGEYLTDPLVRVPLLLRLPDGPGGRRDDVVALVDLFPTLLRLLGGEAEAAQLPGRDLLAPDAAASQSVPYLATQAASSVPRYGIVDGDYKFVLSRENGGWRGELFRRGRDAFDLSRFVPQLARALRLRLDRQRQQLLRPRPRVRQPLSPADREKLRALGYTEHPRTHPQELGSSADPGPP